MDIIVWTLQYGHYSMDITVWTLQYGHYSMDITVWTLHSLVMPFLKEIPKLE